MVFWKAATIKQVRVSQGAVYQKKNGRCVAACPGFAPRSVREHISSPVCLPETDVSHKLPNKDELERSPESMSLRSNNFYSPVLSCLFQSKLATKPRGFPTHTRVCSHTLSMLHQKKQSTTSFLPSPTMWHKPPNHHIKLY